jgi:ABC-type transport system involved in multi-copper enzyme maturation permease subunit
MKTIFIIALDSVLALLHQKLLLGLMLATLAITIYFTITLSSARTHITSEYSSGRTNAATSTTVTNGLSDTERRQFRASMESVQSAVQAMFYEVASFGGSLVSLFIFSTAVVGEIRRGTIRITLSKPVSRNQFLFGKYLGGVIVMAGYAIIISFAILIFASSQRVEVNPALKWAPWLMFCRQLMLGSVAMFLSLFVHPMIASVLAFVAGNGLCSPPNPFYFLLPSYRDFNVFFQVLQGSIVRAKDVGFLTLYALDFIIIILLLALWRFRKKEVV